MNSRFGYGLMKISKHGTRAQPQQRTVATRPPAARTVRTAITAVVMAAFLTSMARGADSQPTTISSVEEFKNWAASVANGQFGHVELATNLTFDETDSNTIFPLGFNKNDGTCTAWSGIFDGKNHQIDGSASGNSTQLLAGLFCELTNSNVKNVIIGKGWEFCGEIAGAMCSSSSGNITFSNVRNDANVRGVEEAGGLIGYYGGGTNLVFENCTNNGQIEKVSEDLSYYIALGGFVGETSEVY